MLNRITKISTAAAVALAALSAPALAQEAGTVYGAKTVGAMTFETRGRATNPAQVFRQGGFSVALGTEWIPTPVEQTGASVVHGAGSVGALTLETLGLATSASDVRHQGGARTAAAVRWMSAPAE